MFTNTDPLDCVWKCRCWFCRMFTRRVLSRFVKPHIASGGGGSAMAQEADLVKELKELKTSIEELKRTIVEIKASIADLTGPFSGYKPVEEAEKPVIGASLQAPVQAGVPGAGVERSGERAAEKPAVLEKQAEKTEKSEFSRVITGISEVLREERMHIVETGFKKVLNVMRTLYELRKLYPRTSIESIIKMLEEIRAFTPEEISLLKASVNLIEESLKEGVSHEENVLMMFMLLRQLGVRSEDVEEEALRTILDVLASKRKKQTVSEDAVKGVKEGKSEWESLQQ